MMSELSDDIARGCLPNGEPIEARWGTGEWSQQPEQRQEPDPWEEALAAAEQRGYERALDDMKKYVDTCDSVKLTEIPTTVLNKTLNTLKSSYLKQEGKNGKQN
jgi:hypothetical protein